MKIRAAFNAQVVVVIALVGALSTSATGQVASLERRVADRLRKILAARRSIVVS